MSKESIDQDFNEGQDLPDSDMAEKEVANDNVSEETTSENWEEKFQKLNDDYLRLHAEFDNYRKRTLKEKSELLRSGSERVLSGILPVVDDFERALSNLHLAEDVVAMKEGIELIYNKFLSFLDKNGVKAMETDGQVFDAEQHEALTMIHAQSEEMKNKIVDTVVKGYMLDGKVVRFPKVVVAQ